MIRFNLFNEKSTFEERLSKGTITNEEISFIKESGEIYTNEHYWGGGGIIDSETSTTSKNAVQNKVITAALNNKVDKVTGKQLSEEDFTTMLKEKLDSLKNYDDSELTSKINTIEETMETLFNGDTSSAIESFNEIIAFLEGIEDSESLDNIIASIETQLANKAEKTEVPAVVDILKAVYPVGAIYISTVSTGPATLFGFGTWERIKDRFLLGAGSNYSAGSTGGSATHKLTAKELPQMGGTISTHGVYSGTPIAAVSGVFSASHKCSGKYMSGSASGHDSVDTIVYSNGGEDVAHNNMPPYLTVYMWKRTA